MDYQEKIKEALKARPKRELLSNYEEALIEPVEEGENQMENEKVETELTDTEHKELGMMSEELGNESELLTPNSKFLTEDAPEEKPTFLNAEMIAELDRSRAYRRKVRRIFKLREAIEEFWGDLQDSADKDIELEAKVECMLEKLDDMLLELADDFSI